MSIRGPRLEFAVGAFLAFTLSQAGMVIHWWRERGPGWQPKAALNGLGAAATAAALIVIGAIILIGTGLPAIQARRKAQHVAGLSHTQ